ncbi:MAG: hypothetical protein ACI9UQ_002422 [Candidatus Krumholzibacteriia bacterium]|jgi:hypothetical protein
MTDHSEKRRALRVDANLNLEVKIPLADGSSELATLETINISTSGIYFKSDHFIEPMTKLAMELEVKVPGAAGSSEPDFAAVPCEGIVVRCEPDAHQEDCSEYEIAVFFTHIESDGMTNLEKHIAMLLEEAE